MNKKNLFFSILGIIIIIFIIYNLISNFNQNTNNSNDIDVYNLMMEKLPRNIMDIEPAEMSSDELDFYYNYIYDNTVQVIEMH